MHQIIQKIIKHESKRESALEVRLLEFYIFIELIWTLVNVIAGSIAGLPKITVVMFELLFVLLILYVTVGVLTGKEKLLRELYFILVILTIPVLWHVYGGARTSANILFVCEVVLFVMCTRGMQQKVYLVIALLSVPISQNVARFAPYIDFSERQIRVGSSILGFSTTLVIAALLVKQKAEYAKERDAAVESEKALEKSNRLQKNFLANMSHEIRSPLGIVLGFNDLILENNDLNQIHEYSKDIKQAGSTLLTVINDILDYSKIESGKLDIIMNDYSFAEMVDNIKRDIKLKSDAKGLKLIIDVDDAIPKYLYGDDIRIKQCLLNLLSNAVKYTENGQIDFRIELKEKTDESCTLEYVVKDTGNGIKEEEIGNLFTAFQRLNESANRGIEGTGLGLAITKSLLDEMGGSISVISEEGQGSTFTIILTQKIGKGKTSENHSEEESKNLKGKTVLVVDDARMNLMLIRKLLEKCEMTVTTVDNGREALDITQNTLFDIILLDHMMPEMNGVEVFNELRQLEGANINTPVVMLTANAMAGAEKEYIDMGFDGYLSKPINTSEMYEVISALI